MIMSMNAFIKHYEYFNECLPNALGFVAHYEQGIWQNIHADALHKTKQKKTTAQVKTVMKRYKWD